MSEIFVDTIRKTGGSLGTDIRIKNTSVYESDGGTSITQNIVQALTKWWVNVEQSTNSINDSFNVSGVTDNGTGRSEIAFTNNFSSANYCCTACNRDGGGHNDAINVNSSTDGAYTTSAVEFFCYETNSSGAGVGNDSNGGLWVMSAGDLA